ncbi:hypothetical protein Bca101_059224 [Brassica carinata]
MLTSTVRFLVQVSLRLGSSHFSENLREPPRTPSSQASVILVAELVFFPVVVAAGTGIELVVKSSLAVVFQIGEEKASIHTNGGLLIISISGPSTSIAFLLLPPSLDIAETTSQINPRLSKCEIKSLRIFRNCSIGP